MSDVKRPLFLHPLAGTSLPNWWRVLRHHGGVNGSAITNAAGVTFMSASTAPVRWYESLRHGRAIAAQKLDPSPVFIIGHWRSGTTNMHNHLLRDPQFGCLSYHQCVFPLGFLTMERLVKSVLARKTPKTRIIDQVEAGVDEPMSEDFAMGCLTDMTHYHGYYFPKDADRIFRRTVLFEGTSQADIDRWERQYRYLLQKVAYAAGGRRLLLKNPPHTGRIRQLLKMFPQAKFIHVYRNPFAVFSSTCKLMDTFLRLFSFQKYDERETRTHVLTRYELLMRRYLDDYSQIPSENLIEVAHEEMTSEPMQVLERIYRRLNLPGFEAAKSKFADYVESLRGYKNNIYRFDDETVHRIRTHCQFTMDRWGYQGVAG